MRKQPNLKAEVFRIAGPPHTNCGSFQVKLPGCTISLLVQASDGGGWDHVSVSLRHRCPTWEEMEGIRDLFFRDDEWVVQYSPPRQEKVNLHSYCLHLWRPQTSEEIEVIRQSWAQGGEELGEVIVPGVLPRPPVELV